MGAPPEASAETAGKSRNKVSVAISGQERVGLRLDGTVVLAFTTDGYEGECMVGRKVSARLVKFRCHRAGTGELIQMRTPTRYKNGG